MASYPIVQQYLDEFQKCYPAKKVEVHSRLRNGEAQHRVFIDGHADDLVLSDADLREAITNFKR